MVAMAIHAVGDTRRNHSPACGTSPSDVPSRGSSKRASAPSYWRKRSSRRTGILPGRPRSLSASTSSPSMSLRQSPAITPIATTTQLTSLPIWAEHSLPYAAAILARVHAGELAWPVGARADPGVALRWGLRQPALPPGLGGHQSLQRNAQPRSAAVCLAFLGPPVKGVRPGSVKPLMFERRTGEPALELAASAQPCA